MAVRFSEVASCAGKTRWGSEQSAQRALTSLRKRNPGVFDSTVRPYRCRYGRRNHWHVGHSK